MELVTGGAFQGKLDYAIKEYGFTDADVCECTDGAEPDFSAACIYHYERYVKYCLREGIAPRTDFAESGAAPKVIIMDDVFCGIVPADPELRAWRELCGRTITALAHNADKVTRLFCGIPKTIKP